MSESAPRNENFPSLEEYQEQLRFGNANVISVMREHYRRITGALTDIQYEVGAVEPSPDSEWYEPFQDLHQKKTALESLFAAHDPDFVRRQELDLLNKFK